MADEITRFNEAMAKAVENLQTDMTEVKTGFARIEQILSHYSKNNDLILEVIKEANIKHEAQEKRHFEQMKLISDEHKETSEKAFQAIEDIKTEQHSIKAKLKYAAGALAVISAIIAFFGGHIVDAFTREPEPGEYRSDRNEP